MLQSHSLLWHYLQVGSILLLLALALLMWKRGLHAQFPAFFGYLLLEAFGGAILYAFDVMPTISPVVFWRSFLGFLIAEGIIKFVIIAEVFTHLMRRYLALSKLGKALISCTGVLLLFTATAIAAYANAKAFWLISATRILGRSVSLVQCGLILFLFVFVARFHLNWGRADFGIALGLGVVAAVNLIQWALTVDWLLREKGY